MKHILVFLFIFNVSLPTQVHSQEKLQKLLYPIVENDVWGYMDKQGKIVIKPQFNVAGYFFSDSLAMVAKNGRFGFIDTKGTLIIPPKYDAATRFFDGIARVYLKGKPYFINTKGELLFEHDFKDIYFFTDTGFATVISKDGKKGLIDRSGNIVIEPIYTHFTFFEKEGLALVEKERRNFAVLDTNGNEIVPLNMYNKINYFINGLAFVEYSTDEETDVNDYEGFIDTTGKLILKTTNIFAKKLFIILKFPRLIGCF
ncbi:MAG: WG repeat-containing protein [Bacteroidota bacterium]